MSYRCEFYVKCNANCFCRSPFRHLLVISREWIWVSAFLCAAFYNTTTITSIMRNSPPPPALKNIIRNVGLSVSCGVCQKEIKLYGMDLCGLVFPVLRLSGELFACVPELFLAKRHMLKTIQHLRVQLRSLNRQFRLSILHVISVQVKG